jgi:hypothetical protein
LARPIRLQSWIGKPETVSAEPIENNLDDDSLDAIVTLIRAHSADGHRIGSWTPLEMDRGLNNLFEGAYKLDIREVASRIGAIAVRMYEVDLRYVARQSAEILAWASAQGIASRSGDGLVWTLKRAGVTFLPFGKGWRDARAAFATSSISNEGLIAREMKQRERVRRKEVEFLLGQIEASMRNVGDEVALPDVAKKLLFPCATVGQLKESREGMTGGLALWEIVRLHWIVQQLCREEMDQVFTDMTFW